jgi:hypothetical protein
MRSNRIKIIRKEYNDIQSIQRRLHTAIPALGALDQLPPDMIPLQ